jgi:GNAT superfamily N-acetyltransferase
VGGGAAAAAAGRWRRRRIKFRPTTPARARGRERTLLIAYSTPRAPLLYLRGLKQPRGSRIRECEAGDFATPRPQSTRRDLFFREMEIHPKHEMDGPPGQCLALEKCSARRLAATLAAATRAPDSYVVVSLGPAAALLCASRAPMYPNLPPSPDATRGAQTDDDDPPNFEYIGVSRIAVAPSARRQGHMVALLDRTRQAAALLGRRLVITEVRSERLASILTARPEWIAVRRGWGGAPEAWAYDDVALDAQSATKTSERA